MSPNENTPSFYAIIPANVRYCKDLEPCARLLYGEITALCNKMGFCWASNSYFAELYEVDESTVKRWINSLKTHGFIFLDTKKDGVKWSRKIFISQEMFTKAQNCPLEGSLMSPYYYNVNNIKKQQHEGERPTQHVVVSPNEIEKKKALDQLPSITEAVSSRVIRRYDLTQILQAVQVCKEAKDIDDINRFLQDALKKGWVPSVSKEKKQQQEKISKAQEIRRYQALAGDLYRKYSDKRSLSQVKINEGHITVTVKKGYVDIMHFDKEGIERFEAYLKSLT